MNRKNVLLGWVTILIGFSLVACDTVDLTASLGLATSTATSTASPTFTALPSMTPTPKDTLTPEPTATAIASATFPKPTVAVATPRPTTPRPTFTPLKIATLKSTVAPPKTSTPKATVPTATPPLKLEWKQSTNYNIQGRCDAGPGTFEVKGRIYGGNAYVGGIHVVVIGRSGNIIAQGDSRYPIELNPEWGVSCFEEKNMFNYQLDISAGRNESPLTLRLTRSKTDLTPISADIRFDITPGGGRWYYDFIK